MTKDEILVVDTCNECALIHLYMYISYLRWMDGFCLTHVVSTFSDTCLFIMAKNKLCFWLDDDDRLY